jgi:hypothetical protein
MIQNAKDFPEIFYGLHFAPGVAQYADGPSAEPYKILIEEPVMKKMDPSFAGKPVYVQHVDKVDLKNIQSEADGYVSESFYNPPDGKHWVKFIVVTDEAKQAIKSGWKLSNAYVVKSFGQGGLWHGVEYSKEVSDAVYEHMAIVNDPRYEESIILSPEAFKKYNEDKDGELKRLANSKDQTKGEKKMANFEFYKRARVENSIDIESTFVELPKSRKEMSIAQLIVEQDKVQNMAGYASPDHMVKVNEEEMSVKDLVKKHMDMCNEMAEMQKKKDDAKSSEGGEPGKGADDDEMDSKKNDPDEESTVAAGMKDVDSRGGDKHLNDEDDAEGEKQMEKKKNAISKAERLKNAQKEHLRNSSFPTPTIELGADKVARGKDRYGSN